MQTLELKNIEPVLLHLECSSNMNPIEVNYHQALLFGMERLPLKRFEEIWMNSCYENGKESWPQWLRQFRQWKDNRIDNPYENL